MIYLLHGLNRIYTAKAKAKANEKNNTLHLFVAVQQKGILMRFSI
jgi:hypothetical protein